MLKLFTFLVLLFAVFCGAKAAIAGCYWTLLGVAIVAGIQFGLVILTWSK